MKRVISCVVVGHFGLVSGEVWWANHEQVLLWCEEELSTGGEVRVRMDVITGADLVDCMLQTDRRLPPSFCKLPNGHLHLGGYSLVEEQGEEEFRKNLAQANPTLKLFSPSYLPPPLTRHIKDSAKIKGTAKIRGAAKVKGTAKIKGVAKAEASPAKEPAAATPTPTPKPSPRTSGSAASKLRERSLKNLRQEQERQEISQARAEEATKTSITAEEQQNRSVTGDRRRLEDVLRLKMGAEGEEIAAQEEEAKRQALSGEGSLVGQEEIEGPGSDPGFGSKQPSKPRRMMLTTGDGEAIEVGKISQDDNEEPEIDAGFKPEEMSGLDALILAAEEPPEPKESGLSEDVENILGAWLEDTTAGQVSVETELEADEPAQDGGLSTAEQEAFQVTDDSTPEPEEETEPETWEFDASSREVPAVEQAPESEPEPAPKPKPKKKKLTAETRRLLPAALGPGSPPSIMLRVADPAQLRRTLTLTVEDERAVFRIRPEPKLEAEDPVKIFLTMPGGVYLELEGLVYEDNAPGTHMVVEPLEEHELGTLRDASETR